MPAGPGQAADYRLAAASGPSPRRLVRSCRRRWWWQSLSPCAREGEPSIGWRSTRPPPVGSAPGSMRIGSTILAHDRAHRTHLHRVAAYPTKDMAPRRRAACPRTCSPFTTYWCSILRMPSRDVREHMPQHRGICMTQSARPFPNLSSVLRWLRPSPILKVPTEHEEERQIAEATRGIVRRQAEGSVLLAAGRFNAAGLDLTKDDDSDCT